MAPKNIMALGQLVEVEDGFKNVIVGLEKMVQWLRAHVQFPASTNASVGTQTHVAHILKQ